jgi:hypothetical protein
MALLRQARSGVCLVAMRLTVRTLPVLDAHFDAFPPGGPKWFVEQAALTRPTWSHEGSHSTRSR